MPHRMEPLNKSVSKASGQILDDFYHNDKLPLTDFANSTIAAPISEKKTHENCAFSISSGATSNIGKILLNISTKGILGTNIRRYPFAVRS